MFSFTFFPGATLKPPIGATIETHFVHAPRSNFPIASAAIFLRLPTARFWRKWPRLGEYWLPRVRIKRVSSQPIAFPQRRLRILLPDDATWSGNGTNRKSRDVGFSALSELPKRRILLKHYEISRIDAERKSSRLSSLTITLKRCQGWFISDN